MESGLPRQTNPQDSATILDDVWAIRAVERNQWDLDTRPDSMHEDWASGCIDIKVVQGVGRAEENGKGRRVP